MSPDIVKEANEGGLYAIDLLIGIIHGILLNCFVAEFEDDRVQREIHSHINQLQAGEARKKIKVLLNEIKKQNHFICCLIPDYLGVENDLTRVIKQAEKSLLDILILTKEDASKPLTMKAEITTLEKYNQSKFAQSRLILAQGKTLVSNELSQYELLDAIFKKALMYASRIEICDRIFGRKFGDNFRYSFLEMFKWLEKNVVDPVRLEKIIIHCEKPRGYGDDHMIESLKLVKCKRLSKIQIEIRFYSKDSDLEGECLPHERFLMTDQIAFNIGRGMDFLSKRTKRNRDISIYYANNDAVNALIGTYRQYNKLDPIVL